MRLTHPLSWWRVEPVERILRLGRALMERTPQSDTKMYRDPKDCYAHARLCRELVRETENQRLREMFLQVRLAKEVEVTQKPSDQVPTRRGSLRSAIL
jgi:hypothetical protein